MEQKGLVGHRRAGRAYVHFALVDARGDVPRAGRRLLERVFDGAVDEYLVHALHARRISPAELDRLEKMIAEAKTETKPRREKR